MRRAAGLALAAVLLVPTGGISAQDADPGRAASKPNVVVIMTDDQRHDDIPPIAKTQRLIGGEGVTFDDYYASYPVCCPARATFFTGQYAQNHRVRCLYPWCGGGYGHLDQSDYLPVWLEDAGYVTAHIGKFLNGYGKERGTPMRPRGWTEWYGLIDHSTYRMWGYSIFENDHRVTYGKLKSHNPRLYQTDVLTNKAVKFIDDRAGREKPFFLSVAYLAPHHESGYTQKQTKQLVRAAPRYEGHYSHQPLPRPPNYNEADVFDKPPFLGHYNRLITPKREHAILDRFHARWNSLLAVDDGVERIIAELRQAGVLENTYVIFTSDNGFMQGEHRVREGKMLPYDASTHLPFLIRGPGIPRGRTTHAVVGDVDLAATITDITGARPGHVLDGRSLLKYARNVHLKNNRPFLHTTAGQGSHGRTNTREGGARGTETRVPAWSAVRTASFLYVSYKSGHSELYRLTRDRWEMHSLADDPNFRTKRNTLRRLLGDLRRCRGRSCDKLASASVR
jgi:N-acetylglucosamine-6-sulfatase